MAKVHLNFNELCNAFKAYRKYTPNAENSICCCLDMFYAVECGLAAVLLHQIKRGYTSESSTEDLFAPHFNPKIGNHDISSMILHCNPNNRPIDTLPKQLKCNPLGKIRGDHISGKDIHSALRYGAGFVHEQEWKKYAKELAKICDWVSTQLRRG